MILRPNPIKLSNIELGRLGEKAAQFFLEQKGLRVIEKNFRCPLGEIDLIARDREKLIFIEVKTRRGLRTQSRFGPPEEAVHAAKRKKLRCLIEFYLKANHLRPARVQLDVLALNFLPETNRFKIRRIPNAL